MQEHLTHANGADYFRPAPPVLPKETVAVEGLGEVVVCGLKLSQRLALGRQTRQSKGDAAATDLFVPRLLAATVTDMAGNQLFNVDEWDIYGAQHPAAASRLSDVAMRLGGFLEAEAKND